ncbi:MAG: hypothetical protein QOJ94_1867 [Sphingomonadales bacterium]|jgi:hypothetical protein|nr:hypothetical protein [Sphingomonadales bacterium]
MGLSDRLGKIGEMARRVHPLVKDPQHQNVTAFGPEINEVMVRLETLDDYTEVDRPDADRIGKEGVAGGSKTFGIKVRLRRSPLGVRIRPDFSEVGGSRTGESQAARDFAFSRACAMI